MVKKWNKLSGVSKYDTLIELLKTSDYILPCELAIMFACSAQDIITWKKQAIRKGELSSDTLYPRRRDEIN